jgi:Ca2+-binding EF-hand superfamily protein
MLVLALATTSTTVLAQVRGDNARVDRVAEDRTDRVRPDRERRDQRRHSPRQRIIHIFNSLDADENEVVTLDEFLAKPLAKAEKQFARIDTDDDELISYEEFLAIHGDRPERDDVDIDVDELRACIAASLDQEVQERPDPETRFDLIDTNSDGYIDLDEFSVAKTNSAEEKFHKIDVDADGGITLQELAHWLLAQRKHREVRRACVEEQQEMNDLIAE